MADPDSKKSERWKDLAQRGRWLPIATTLIAVGTIVGLSFLALQYFRDSSYHDERAFRVLGQVVDQFGNFQGAIAGALKLVPQDTFVGSDQAKARKAYSDRLALRDVKLANATPSLEQEDVSAGLRPFTIDSRVPVRTFSMSIVTDAPRAKLTLSGPLGPQLPTFITQDLFDSVIFATSDGVSLSTLSAGSHATQQVVLHPGAQTDLLGGSASGLLREAAERVSLKDRDKEKASLPASVTAPAHATVFSSRIGGQPFRVYVLPFHPVYDTRVEKTSADAALDPRLYLIGLERQNVLVALNDALGSGGKLFVTLAVLLGVLCWPLAALRFSSPREGIAPAQLFAVALALVLIPAVLATAGFAVWTRARLISWADQHAELYARRVESVLIDELHSNVHTLESLAAQFAAIPEYREQEFQMKVPPGQQNFACVKPHSDCATPLKLVPRANPPEDWSALRSAAPLNTRGLSEGLTLSFFEGNAAVRPLDLQDRQYYRSIMAGEEWNSGDLWAHAETPVAHRYVAQRLFNRTDAARVLQVAVPIEFAQKRIGVMTGDSRVYGLASTLRAPLLRFAVVDSLTGTVLFHSQDHRSLGENMLTETENNASLVTALSKRASKFNLERIAIEDHFAARYLGASHRFYHRAFPGAPWGLLVSYPIERINQIVLQTSIATLATYFAFITVVTAVLCLTLAFLRGRADRALQRWLWPKWSSFPDYRRLLRVLALCLFVFAFVLVARLNVLRWVWVLAILAVAVLAALALGRFASPLLERFYEQRILGLASYTRSYIGCMVGVLTLVSALPSILLAIGYHDTSVRAFVLNELQEAARDEDVRRGALRRDERRFADATPREDRAAKLSRELSVPGYRWAELGARGESRWVLTDVAPAPWLSECGPPRLGELRRIVWVMSTARSVQRPLNLSGAREESRQEGCPPFAVRAWRRSDDGTVMFTALPLRPAAGDPTRIQTCGRGAKAMCRDADLNRVYGLAPGLVLTLSTLVVVLLLVLMCTHTARRLLGIRIPFAGRLTPNEVDSTFASQLLDAELTLVELEGSSRLPVTTKDESDFRAVRCAPIYEKMWQALGVEEQLLLHQLATGRYANPENQPVIERLIRRGYLRLAPWPTIVEPGFAEFIRTAPHTASFDKLSEETAKTVWGRVRAPLLVLVIVVAIALMWLAGSAMQILTGVLAGVATLLGTISQVTSFVRDKSAKP